MYYDPLRNAYVDPSDGSIIPTEDGDDIPYAVYSFPEEFHELEHISTKQDSSRSPQNGAISLEEELFSLHVSDNLAARNEQDSNDWTFARSLQALEFEISNDMLNGIEDGDFNEKEYYAFKSCRRQLLTISFFICVGQIIVLIIMIQTDGYAPKSENPVIGPPVYTMVRFGAKQAALIIVRGEWWRVLSSIMLHAGIMHIVPNVLIQLRIGGYLNILYGTPKWLWIYLVSGVFGAMMSCIFLPNAVGVGSSGALMGMLSSWITWMLFRWNKIPERYRSQRNCQLGVGVGAVAITLATSFAPNVDWAAHFGGALQGILWGTILLSNQLDVKRNEIIVRVGALVVSLILFIYSFYYMIVKLNPSTSTLSYWDENDD